MKSNEIAVPYTDEMMKLNTEFEKLILSTVRNFILKTENPNFRMRDATSGLTRCLSALICCNPVLNREGKEIELTSCIGLLQDDLGELSKGVYDEGESK